MIDPRYSTENFHKNIEIVEKLKVFADRHNATTGQVALAWLLAQGDNIVTIPGYVLNITSSNGDLPIRVLSTVRRRRKILKRTSEQTRSIFQRMSCRSWARSFAVPTSRASGTLRRLLPSIWVTRRRMVRLAKLQRDTSQHTAEKKSSIQSCNHNIFGSK